VIFLPLAFLFGQALSASPGFNGAERIFPFLFRSFVLASVIAATAVLLGWNCGRLLGTSRSNKDLLLLLLLTPLVLPQYVLYYAWTLLLTPTTGLGSYLAAKGELARYIGTFTSLSVLILWYWPLASLLIAQGWRNIDRGIWDCASLDVGGFKLFRYVELPLLRQALLLAFGACFALSLSEFATFHLAGVHTIGTELAVLYELTGSESCVARAGWPVTVVSLIVAIGLGKSLPSWISSEPAIEPVKFRTARSGWAVLLTLLGISVGAPVAVLIYNVTGTQAFKEFLTLHIEELSWSLIVAVVSAVIAYLIARGALSLERSEKSGSDVRGALGLREVFGFVVRGTIFLAMFAPASVVAVSMLKMLACLGVPAEWRQNWLIVSAGQASRFAGVALILLLMMRHPYEKTLAEMASLDGASRLKTWWYVQLPQSWPIFVGTFILVIMFSVTELPATMVLLPAGLPNFAQRLLNQMHYARDQQVIASCLVLICLFIVLAAAVVLLIRGMRSRQRIAVLIVCAAVLGLTGCGRRSRESGVPNVVGAFGRTGSGPGEFVYPRVIEIAADGSLFVVDKTGRIQHLTTEGNCLAVFNMPKVEAGKPTGLTIGPDGKLYVADTHYHRVVIFSSDGKIIGEFGKFGQENGCFIYPTDVAFSGDGKTYVSEYGGNDRVSVFNEQGDFLYSFGSPGGGSGQLSRPSALSVDLLRKRLYVTDACNHRIAIYTFDGHLQGYIGSVGTAPGELRYPYDVTLLPDGTLVVCEFGNNRIQLFSPEGQSIAVYGRAGRQLGELAYPWGVVVDGRRRAFIVDAGNNRIQVWQL
jgi:ABC-type Fe3+ transport system permease subunit/DNA-binding beta-propeller fold protein YncE